MESSLSKRLVRSRCRLNYNISTGSSSSPSQPDWGILGRFVTDVIRNNIRGCELFFNLKKGSWGRWSRQIPMSINSSISYHGDSILD